ncbi:hypothetical protein HMPREF9628_02003 [Peptoanaerobacter stomatis]|uniref:Heparan-alpha-glucosaminide N-acetyltransferase catalytic domain-containing protein n=1 Tax=Peptoanaerobacter stomatis TaxID=796937 RepID=G9XDY0_9FIRM|nr:heparan-alpha-glucosaminide N-acetyltransferase domain-containing protein [Peptoanaerobacter stomatis]EHL18821.1 hypothetical protein HMPREF9628_02003 [Peptoanaerobacter stomatis]
MSNRIYIIDFLRGFTIIHMIIYHTLYDLKYVFSVNMPFFSTNSWYFYQQYICMSFIFLSGFSTNFSKKLLRNAVKLSIISIIITVVTTLVSDEFAIKFGVIHFLAFSMLAIFFVKKIEDKSTNSHKNCSKNRFQNETNYKSFKKFGNKINIEYAIFSLITLSIFIVLKSKYFLKSDIYVDIYNFMQKLPLSFIYGFPRDDFYSADYFPIIPWIFLSFTGYFIGKFYKDINTEKIFEIKTDDYKNEIKYELECKEKIELNKIFRKNKILSFICVMGRHSLFIYILHQVVIYGVLYIIFEIIIN